MASKAWAWWASQAAGWLLGGVLLLAAAAKVFEPGAFVEQIRLEGLDFLLPAAAVALMALALEVGLGAALLLGVHHRLVLASTTLLTAFFLFLTGRNYWLVSAGLRDPDASCGCFGSLIERTPAEAFWQDLLLLAPPLLILLWLRWGKGTALPPIRVGFSVFAALAVTVGTWLSPAMHFSEAAAAIKASAADAAFRASESFQLEVDGEIRPAGEVLESDGAAGVLLMAPGLTGAALIDPQSGEVRLLAADAVRPVGDGTYLLAERAEPVRSIEFEIEGGAIQFQMDGKVWRLVAR